MVKRPEREFNNSPPSSTEFTMTRAVHQIPLHAFMGWTGKNYTFCTSFSLMRIGPCIILISEKKGRPVVVQPALGYHITNSQFCYLTPTRLKSAHYSLHNNAPSSRKLLKMDVLTSETCWAVNWHNKASVIKLVYLYSKSFSLIFIIALKFIYASHFKW